MPSLKDSSVLKRIRIQVVSGNAVEGHKTIALQLKVCPLVCEMIPRILQES